MMFTSYTNFPKLKLADLQAEVRWVFDSADYVDVGTGWLGIIRRFIADAQPLDPQMQIVEMKEKFGGLRLLHDSDVDDVVMLKRLAESRSAFTCEVCGRDGEIKLPPEGKAGWRKCLCVEHTPDLMSDWRPSDRPPRAYPIRGVWYRYDRDSDTMIETDVPTRWKRDDV